jgi:hypothetical protein
MKAVIVLFRGLVMKKLLILALGLASFTGCSGDANGPKDTADDTLKTPDAFCKAWAGAACNAAVVDACGAKDADDCIASQRQYCTELLPVGYDSTNAEQCITAVKRAFKDAELDQSDLDLVLNLGGDCSHLIRGGSASGDTCTVASECNTVKGYSCVIKPGDTEGTCQLAKLQSAGQSCDALDELCIDGYYCVATAAGGGICGEQGQDNDACDDDSMCISTDLCDLDTNKCAPKLDVSDPCSANSQCKSGICLLTAAKPKCVNSVVLTPEASLCADLGG